MPLLKILSSGRITLPLELRVWMGLKEGDYLEVEATLEGILLKPMAVVERQRAGKALGQLLNRMHAGQPTSDLSAEEQEELIAEEVKASREEKH
jgi:AbrB family looped-hinge helix DNA binding protein